MGTPFNSDAVGGVTLLTPAIQSPNFSIADQTGWAIMQNGDAYFFDITASGDVTATEVEAGTSPNVQIVIAGSGGEGTIQIQLNNVHFVGGEINGAVVGSPAYASTGIYGPAGTLSGHTDYVAIGLNSANSSGTSTANMQFFYYPPSGAGVATAVYNNDGWTFYTPVTCTDGLNLGMAVPVNYPNSHISTTPTAAEFNAIVDTLNNLIAIMIGEGLIA